jgi:hypothetical protein
MNIGLVTYPIYLCDIIDSAFEEERYWLIQFSFSYFRFRWVLHLTLPWHTWTWFLYAQVCLSYMIWCWDMCICDYDDVWNHEHDLLGLLRPWSKTRRAWVSKSTMWWHPKPWTRSSRPSETTIKDMACMGCRGCYVYTRDRGHLTIDLLRSRTNLAVIRILWRV